MCFIAWRDEIPPSPDARVYPNFPEKQQVDGVSAAYLGIGYASKSTSGPRGARDGAQLVLEAERGRPNHNLNNFIDQAVTGYLLDGHRLSSGTEEWECVHNQLRICISFAERARWADLPKTLSIGGGKLVIYSYFCS